jgi:hypothetical protein
MMKFSHGWMSDTHPDALRALLDIQSGIPPEEKLQLVAEMYDARSHCKPLRYASSTHRRMIARYFSALLRAGSDPN